MIETKSCAACGRIYQSEQDFLSGTSRWRLCTQGHLWFNCQCGSTLMLKRGRFSWYQPEYRLGPEARGLFNTLGNLKDLPHIPTSIMEIQQLLRKEDVSPKEIAQSLRYDPVMAAQVLQIAENIRASRNPVTPRISALEHAIVYIGFRALSELIMTTALRAMPVPKSDFDITQFWRESYLTGSVAEALARQYAPSLNPDEVFLTGSLCNVGKLVLAFCFPRLASQVSRNIENISTEGTWRRAETAHGIPDHCILGEIASTLWGFPEYIMHGARRHHELIPATGPKQLELAEIVALANQMTHWVLLQPHRMEYEIVQSFQARVGLTDEGVEALARELSPMGQTALASA